MAKPKQSEAKHAKQTKRNMAKPKEIYFYAVTFEIKNCSLYEERSYVSKSFSTGRITWILEFSISRYSPEPFASLFLVPVGVDQEVTLDEINCSLEILDENERNIIKREFGVSPYVSGSKIGTSRFVSPFKVFDVLAQSKEDTIIVRLGLVKDQFRSEPTIYLMSRSEIELESCSFKWIVEDLTCPWKRIKSIHVFQTNIDISLKDTLTHIEVGFKLSERLWNVILVCRVSFSLDHDEVYGIRHSKVFKHENVWQFPNIERELLGLKAFTKALFCVHFEISFWNGDYHVHKYSDSPLKKIETQICEKSTYVPNIKKIRSEW